MVRIERSDERWEQEFQIAHRELTLNGFEAIHQRFEDMNKQLTALQWIGTVVFVVLGIRLQPIFYNIMGL